MTADFLDWPDQPHVMVDLETMATTPDAAIVAIGAVRFHLDDELTNDTLLLDCFYEVVALERAVEAGGRMDPQTIRWWLENNTRNFEQPLGEGATLLEVLRSFSAWLIGSDPLQMAETTIWGDGAAFDNVILESAYRMSGYQVPWTYRQNRCFRTLRNLFPHVLEDLGANPRPHHAMHDALYNARGLQAILRHIINTGGSRE